MQTLLYAIGSFKQFDVWIPKRDRNDLDRSIMNPIICYDRLPQGFENAEGAFPEIDVIWVERGSGKLRALYEVEHSTQI